MNKELVNPEEVDLAENEYLAKWSGNTAFLSKLTKKGTLPKAFASWRNETIRNGFPIVSKPLPIYLHTETFRSGWAFVSYRIGVSQNWAKVRSPEGWVVEIYLRDLMDLVKRFDMKKGVIQGDFLWSNKTLIFKGDVV